MHVYFVNKVLIHFAGCTDDDICTVPNKTIPHLKCNESHFKFEWQLKQSTKQEIRYSSCYFVIKYNFIIN